MWDGSDPADHCGCTWDDPSSEPMFQTTAWGFPSCQTDLKNVELRGTGSKESAPTPMAKMSDSKSEKPSPNWMERHLPKWKERLAGMFRIKVPYKQREAKKLQTCLTCERGLKSCLVGGLGIKFSHKDWCVDNPVPPEEMCAFHQLTALLGKITECWGSNLCEATHGFHQRHDLAWN